MPTLYERRNLIPEFVEPIALKVSGTSGPFFVIITDQLTDLSTDGQTCLQEIFTSNKESLGAKNPGTVAKTAINVKNTTF